MTKPLIFLGHSLQVLDFVDLCDRLGITIAGIIDSDYYTNTNEKDGIPIIGSELTANFNSLKETYDFFIGVNPVPTVSRNINKRLHYIDIVDQYKLPCANLIDPDTRVNSRAVLGKGIYIGAYSVIGPYVVIKDHVQVCPTVGIGHHAVIGQNVILQRRSTVISTADIGDNTYVGLSAKLLKPDNMKVGKNSLIHPGVTVMRDIADNEVVSLTGKNTRKIYDTVII